MYLTRLRYFIVTAEEGSVVRAAHRLRVAQPAVSRQLHVLEIEIGTPLFERHARGVRLLPAGRAFLEYAQRVLNGASAGAEAARRAATDAMQRCLRVAPPDWVTRSRWIVAAADQLVREIPHVRVEYQVVPWLRHAAAVHAGLIDIGFGIGMSAADFGVGVVAERLCDEPGSSAVLPAMHPLARRASINLVDLRDLPMLLPPRDEAPLLYDQMLALVRSAGYEPKILVGGANFSASVQLAAVGAGWILATNSAGDVPVPDIVVVPIRDADVMLGFYALRCCEATEPACQLIACLRSVASGST